jgi:peptidyl-prolyl cis-trans isomerase A (cyclophilin A)
MKLLLLTPLASLALLAQNAPPKAPAKSAPAAPAAGSRLLHPELFKAKAPDLYRVKFTTSKGDFVVEVHRDWSPLGADRFYNLVRSGYFTGNAFYRMVPGVLVQFGINPNPAATKAWSAAPIKDDPRTQHNTPGTIVFANAGPNTRANQLFINLQDNSSQLDQYGPPRDGAFGPIGTVTEGLDTVKGLYGGYGEMKEQGGGGPSQALYTAQGKPYLDKGFPLIDKIVSTSVIFPEAPAASAKKAPGTAAKK